MKRIDFSKLNYHKEPLSMEDALKDIKPLKLNDDIINGDKKITINAVSKESNSKCVKLEIFC